MSQNICDFIFSVVVTGGAMFSHVKMTVYWGTFSLAYNNGNFYPFHLFKAPGARASWCAGECVCTRGIWWKIRHLHGSPEKPAIKSQQPWRRTEIAHCVCWFRGYSSPRVSVTYRCFWSHGYCSELCNRFGFPAMARFQIAPSDEFYTFDSFRADSLFGSFWACKFSVLVNIFQMLMQLLWVQDCANV